MNNPAVLIIDDEAQIRRLLQITLESNGYTVLQAGTGKEGTVMAATHPPDIILLDIGLPDDSGHHILKQLREWYNQPIIILSVQSSEEDIVKALDAGANDFLVKPFRTGELLARLRSALRKNANEESPQIITAGDLQLDLTARIVKKGNEPVKFTATEYTLLALFAKNEGRVLTHHYLLREVWGPGYITQSQYLRVFIAQLRKKIEQDPNRPKHIITESGVGYRFTAE